MFVYQSPTKRFLSISAPDFHAFLSMCPRGPKHIFVVVVVFVCTTKIVQDGRTTTTFSILSSVDKKKDVDK